MAKDATYHRSAVLYNEGFMKFARDMADKVDHEDIKQWCLSIANQHEFHLERHRKALEKMEKNVSETPDNDPTPTAPEPVENVPEPEQAPDPVEAAPNPEQTPEPVENAVGTPQSGVEEGIFVNERTELQFNQDVVDQEKQEQIA